MFCFDCSPSDSGVDDVAASKKPHVQPLEASQAMSASWSWLWNNSTFSDIRIMLLADVPRDEVRDQGIQGQAAPGTDVFPDVDGWSCVLAVRQHLRIGAY